MPSRAFAFCIALAATIVWAMWPLLGSDYTYREFVVGTITLAGDRKSTDYAAVVLLVAVSLVLLYALHRYRLRVPEFDAANHLLGLALIPLVAWLGSALTSSALPAFPYAWAIAAVVVLAFCLWRSRTAAVLDRGETAHIGELVLCSALMSFFAGLALALALFHSSGHAWPRSATHAAFIAGAALLVNAGIVSIAFARAADSTVLQRRLERWLVVLQFALPFLGLVLLPPQLNHRGAPQPYTWPSLLMIVLAVYAACAWVRLARRLHRLGSPHALAHGWLEPMALAMLAVFLSAGHPTFELLSSPGYPTIFGDDFHLGEQVLPWQQWIDFHRAPYADFAPVHGLMPLLTGALDALLFDGTLAHMNLAFGTLVAMASALTVLLASRAGNRALVLALCFLAVPLDRLLFVAPALLVIADAALLARPGRWLAAWAALCVFMLGYNAAIGTAFTGGTTPIALMMLWRVWTRDHISRRNLVLCCIGVLALVAATGPLRRTVFGFVAFLYENGMTNTVGHGIPWHRGWAVPGRPANTVLADRLLFDMLRLAWIAVALYALWRAIEMLRAPAARTSFAFVFAASTGLMLLLLSAWSLGRIDVAIATRTGAVSFLAVGTLLPILYVVDVGLPRVGSLAAFAFVAVALADMHGLNDRFMPQALVARTVQQVEVPANLQRISGADLSSPRLGTLFVSKEQAGEISAFNQALGRVLAPGQTYFDLTNRQALYYYTSHAVPSLYAATFNALNETQQRRMLRQLSSAPPAAVFVAPALEGDGIGASLRSFHLYRHFVRAYRPISIGSHLFLVHEGSPAYAAAASGTQASALIDAAFAHPDLQWLPASWGESWPGLEGKVQKIGDLVAVPAALAATDAARTCNPREADDTTWAPIARYESPASQSRVTADLLEIHLEASTRLPSALRLVYSSEDGARHTIDMRVRGTTLIVPVSSYPSWLRAGSTPAVSVCAKGAADTRTRLIASVRGWSIPELTP